MVVFKRKCRSCGCEYEYEGDANLITFCPGCGSYDHLECEYGYAAVVPCRVYHGSRIIGTVTYSDDPEKRYRVDSDVYGVHKLLEKEYLEALYEARDMFDELIKQSKTE